MSQRDSEELWKTGVTFDGTDCTSADTTESQDSIDVEDEDDGVLHDDFIERVCQKQMDDWLAHHGETLFALQSSKFLSKREKREMLKKNEKLNGNIQKSLIENQKWKKK